MTTINPSFSIRNVYGRLLAYPTNELARVFTKLTGTQALTPGQLRTIQEGLGMELLVRHAKEPQPRIAKAAPAAKPTQES